MPKRIDLNQLFETTVRIYAERGYSGTATLEVSHSAGVNEATLYRRFGNKANLIVAALSHCLAQSPMALLEATNDLHNDLLTIVSAYKRTQQLYGGAVVTMLNEVSHHPELNEALTVMRANTFKAVEIIMSHQEQGRLKSTPPVQLVVYLLSPLMMTGLWNRTNEGSPSFDLAPADIVDNFLHGHQMQVDSST